MDRRNFIQRVTAGATGAVATAPAAQAQDRKSVIFNIKGFTCIACAVGLEVMLREQKGVIKVKASYMDRRVRIEFDAAATTEDHLGEFIGARTGFSASKESASGESAK